MRSTKDYAVIFLKGIGMGAADVVPGVSGGTIAFISGIYEELLKTISNVNLGLLKTLKAEGLKSAWKQANGNFLAALLTGIGVSIVSLAKIISVGLEEHPLYIWSFFFGLILASIPFMGKQVSAWNLKSILALIAGAAVAYYITIMPANQGTDASWFIFISGAIAICAMILPGISGSFILLLMGSYQVVLGGIKDFDLQTIAVFGIGCLVGLLSFSRVLNWLFKNYRNVTLAVLTGFLVGSLNKIWPWKETVKSVVIKGEERAIEQISIAPITDDLIVAVPMAIVGFLLIYGLEKLAVKKPDSK